MKPQIRKSGNSKLVFNKEKHVFEVDKGIPERYAFSGLWVTDQDRFVEVLTAEEAFILQEDGKRLARCAIDQNGRTEFVGSLQEKQRGDEQKTGKGLNWPTLKGGKG